VIVPSAMTLTGRACWYLPGWLEWLPKLKVEGGDGAGAADEAGAAG